MVSIPATRARRLDGGQVMGPSAFDAVARYRQAGMSVTAAWSEPPDHIGVELEFMSHLAAKYIAALSAYPNDEMERLLEAQQAFLRDHLGRWGPAFAERVREAASCHLYRFLGVFLPEWLAFDRALLDALARAGAQMESPNAHRRHH